MKKSLLNKQAYLSNVRKSWLEYKAHQKVFCSCEIKNIEFTAFCKVETDKRDSRERILERTTMQVREMCFFKCVLKSFYIRY